MLGLPYLADNPLVAAARRLEAPVLLSANAFSKWRRDAVGVPVWHGFNHAPLRHANGLRIALDSAGFVAAAKYRRFPWRVADYMELCAAHDWVWFASMDMCVEPEVARSEDIVLNRLAGTVRLNYACAREAEIRGIEHRLLPVIQGWRPEHYLRCIDKLMPLIAGRPIIGVGSMCRRHVNGPAGVVQILDALDRAFGRDKVRFHLFGLKSSALELVAGHPRVASADSQAYGIHARQAALKVRESQPDFSKSNAFTAAIMEEWYLAQAARLRGAPKEFPRQTGILAFPPPLPTSLFEARLQRVAEELRLLHEDGEIDYGDLNPLALYEAAFLED